MKIRPVIIGFVVGYLAYAVAGFVFPPLSVGFWRLAFTKEVAFDAVGIDGAISDQYIECVTIDRSVTPEVSFRILYLVGTNAAKCHAVVGLRKIVARCYSEYLVRLESSNEQVDVHWMDMVDSVKLSTLAKEIRDFKESMLWESQKEFFEWRKVRAEKKANQALQHNDPSCHESCLRTPRASRGRG